MTQFHLKFMINGMVLILKTNVVNFPFLDGYVIRSPSYGVYIFLLICFANVCSNVDDFNKRNKFLTSQILKQGSLSIKI